MFEQSLLLDYNPAKKTGAMAASLTAQTLLVGALIAIPLIYSDRLPDVRQYISLTLPAPPPPPAPPVHGVTSSSSSRASASTAKPFTAPRHIADISAITDISIAEAPPSFAGGSDTGVPGGMGVAPMIGQFLQNAIIPKPRPAEPVKVPTKPTVVGGDVQSAKLINKVVPVYPALAKQARVSGVVQLMGVIAKDGTIQQLQVVSGPPLLVRAALDAVRQWIYRPTLLNGQAVEVIAPISVNFTLSQQ